MASTEDQILVHELLKRDLLSREKMTKIQEAARKALETEGVSKTLVKFLGIDENKLAEIISEKFNIPNIHDINGLASVPVPGIAEDELLTNFRFIPVICDDSELTIAIVDPPYEKHIDFLKKVTNLNIVPVVLKVSDFDQLYQNTNHRSPRLRPIQIDFDEIDVAKRGVNWANEAEKTGQLPVASKVLEKLIQTAITTNSSDIHIESISGRLLNIKYRLNGVLQRVVTLPEAYSKTIPSIIKQSGSTDSFGKGKIQEGHSIFTVQGRQVHTRINIIPISAGEKITIRILKKHLDVINLEEIGFSLHDFQRIKELLSFPESVILFVGPAGCGKTTTLYSSLNELKHDSKNIATVESPIESLIEGINQISIMPGKDHSFADAIRALFHHDVDILALGEIRQKEEAELMIEAGLTGMAAFSTLQAANAIKSIYRLQHLGVSIAELALVIRGIVAQRFVRRICPHCITEHRPDAAMLERAGLRNLPDDFNLKRGTGCKSCLGSGYLNRIPLFEILMINDRISSMIQSGKSYNEIKISAEANGFTDMRYDGIRKALAGITTLEEIVRVT
ncbi:MAG: ATPase, T2SS/T4P/T4SS family [bacterium]|nr:ATPase, T2SS/T4P/T4SS family [bacterium]